MFPMVAHKVMSIVSVVLASGGATTAAVANQINDSTLVPLGLLVGGIGLTAMLAWRVATMVINLQRDNLELRKQTAAQQDSIDRLSVEVRRLSSHTRAMAKDVHSMADGEG